MQPMTIQVDDKIYAQLVDPYSPDKNQTKWIASPHESLQGSVMRYDVKEFRNHKHLLNPRIIKRTQEAFVVVQGSVKVTIFNDNKQRLGELIASKGEAIFVWDGYHKVEFIEEDTIAYEIKAGSFTTVLEDKEFFQ